MSHQDYEIRQIADEIAAPETGKQSLVVVDDDQAKVIAFGFAAGSGLAEHVAPMTAIIQIIQGEVALTVGEESVEGQPVIETDKEQWEVNESSKSNPSTRPPVVCQRHDACTGSGFDAGGDTSG